MTLRRFAIATHRWIGIVAALLWSAQALTGLFCVFHWELEDAGVAGAHHPTDFRAIDRAIAGLDVHSIWTTAAQPDRWDVNLAGKSMRVDGAGNVLRVSNEGENPFENIVEFHQSLLAGDTGRRIIGTSGAFLLSNLIFGVVAAWPKRNQWWRALRPMTTNSRIATLYSWHRALGLWWSIPAICIVTAGMLLAFDLTDPIEPHFDEHGARRISMPVAVDTAMAHYRGAAISGIKFSTANEPVWMITLKQPGEHQRAYGKTRVYISAVDGRLLGEYDALNVPRKRQWLDEVFPFHTGEIAGTVGRWAVFAIGLWLLTMIVLGASLFITRRARRTPSAAAPGADGAGSRAIRPDIRV